MKHLRSSLFDVQAMRWSNQRRLYVHEQAEGTVRLAISHRSQHTVKNFTKVGVVKSARRKIAESVAWNGLRRHLMISEHRKSNRQIPSCQVRSCFECGAIGCVEWSVIDEHVIIESWKTFHAYSVPPFNGERTSNDYQAAVPTNLLMTASTRGTQ